MEARHDYGSPVSAEDYVVPDIFSFLMEDSATQQPAQHHHSNHGVRQVGKHLDPISVESAAYAATAFIRELSGLKTASDDTLAHAMAAASAAANAASLPQIVPTTPPQQITVPPKQAAPAPFAPVPPPPSPVAAMPRGLPGTGNASAVTLGPQIAAGDTSHLTASQLGELELARQRAARAAAGRRQQLIAAKRAKLEAQAQQVEVRAAPSESNKRSSRRQAAAGVAAVTAAAAALHSEDGDETDEDPDNTSAAMSADPVKDARRLKRLLRNRVSAQQARERKKQYLTTLEDEVKSAKDRISQLEKALADSEAQNDALRRIIRNLQEGAAPHNFSAMTTNPARSEQAHGINSTAQPSMAAQQHTLPQSAGLPQQNPANGTFGSGGDLDLDPVIVSSSPLSPQGTCLQLGPLPSMALQASDVLAMEGSGTSNPVRLNTWNSAMGNNSIGDSYMRHAVRRRGNTPPTALDAFQMEMEGLDDDADGLVVPQAPPLAVLTGYGNNNELIDGGHNSLSSGGSLSLQHSH